jgi:hypothetical protein
VEDWAEIRRLHRAGGMPTKAITRRLGSARPVPRALPASRAPPARRASVGRVARTDERTTHIDRVESARVGVAGVCVDLTVSPDEHVRVVARDDLVVASDVHGSTRWPDMTKPRSSPWARDNRGSHRLDGRPAHRGGTSGVSGGLRLARHPQVAPQADASGRRPPGAPQAIRPASGGQTVDGLPPPPGPIGQSSREGKPLRSAASHPFGSLCRSQRGPGVLGGPVAGLDMAGW